MEQQQKKIMLLFDIDGTLTPSRGKITEDMKRFLNNLIDNGTPISFVGGSDQVKLKEQLGEDLLMKGDYSFTENGLATYQKGKLIGTSSIKEFLGEEKLKKFVNFCLHYIAYLDIPIKRGTFIEYRTGMVNVSPIGRNCSQKEREEFYKYDQEHKIRAKFIEVLKKEFPEYGLHFSIGGQISFDVFPEGWDKTYCLKYLKDCQEVHFFGDKTEIGGNDYEIFVDKRVVGHTVKNPEDTKNQIIALLKLDKSSH